jgi:hypothetical protein
MFEFMHLAVLHVTHRRTEPDQGKKYQERRRGNMKQGRQQSIQAIPFIRMCDYTKTVITLGHFHHHTEPDQEFQE